MEKSLNSNVKCKRKYISNLTKEEIELALQMFDTGQSVKYIAKHFEISAPAISRFLKSNNRTPDYSATKYDNLRTIPLTSIQKQFVVGHLLGDGCLYKDRKNSLYKLSISQKKAHSQYFHWKREILNPFVNSWRENVDKRKNSIMLNATTICHPEFQVFTNFFYTENRTKIVPKNLEEYFTPLALAVWIMDDGSLNQKVNMRISTMSFNYNDHVVLQNYLKNVFGLDCKIMNYKYKNKQYYQITFNKENTQKLSNIIRPYIVDCMEYKIMPKL
jgi:ubiquinol-cytochrome c reductase cytochrome b subunit